MLFYKDNFKSLREDCGYSQENLAVKLGVTRQAVQQWESGQAKPLPKKIKNIANILNCSVVDISDIKPHSGDRALNSHNLHEAKAPYDPWGGQSAKDCKIPDCPLKDDDKKAILDYFWRDENRLERFELLAKIEREKKGAEDCSDGKHCGEELAG